MTKARQPDSFADAVLAAIHTLGRERAAAIVGRAVHQVYQWGAPEPDAGRPNVELALRLDVAMVRAGHAPPFLAAWQAQLARVDAPPQAPRDPRDRLTAIMAEVGDVAAEIAKSVGDGRLSAGEIAAITKQGAQARAAIDALLRDLAAGPRLVGGVAKGGEGA